MHRFLQKKQQQQEEDLELTKESLNDHYTLEEVVGRGSFAVVYRAKHIKSGHTFAVKKINKQRLLLSTGLSRPPPRPTPSSPSSGPTLSPPSGPTTPPNRPSIPPPLDFGSPANISNNANGGSSTPSKGLGAEIRMMKSLQHPCIIEFVEYFNATKELAIVMEFAWGGTLGAYLKRNGPLTEDEARVATLRVVGGLHYLHYEKDCVHRDVKADNVMITRSKHMSDVKLGDFGTSRMEGSKATSFVGTPAFLAPEMLQEGGLCYGKEVDAWALGVLVYQMLTNTLPFQGRNNDELFANIRNTRVQFSGSAFRGVSETALDFITQLLQVDPTQRMTMEAAKHHPWLDIHALAQHQEHELPRFMQLTQAVVKRHASSSSPTPRRQPSIGSRASRGPTAVPAFRASSARAFVVARASSGTDPDDAGNSQLRRVARAKTQDGPLRRLKYQTLNSALGKITDQAPQLTVSTARTTNDRLRVVAPQTPKQTIPTLVVAAHDDDDGVGANGEEYQVTTTPNDSTATTPEQQSLEVTTTLDSLTISGQATLGSISAGERSTVNSEVFDAN